MVFRKKKSENRTSRRRRNNRSTVDLAQLIRSRSRYHPYESENDINRPSSNTSRSRNHLSNNSNSNNQLNTPECTTSRDVGTNTSFTYRPEYTQPEVSHISIAKQAESSEKENDIDLNKEEALGLQMENVDKTLITDKATNDNTEDQPGPSHLSPVLQTPNKLSSDHGTTFSKKSISTISYIEEEKPLGLHIIPDTDSSRSSLTPQLADTESAESFSGLANFLLLPQLADLMQPPTSLEDNVAQRFFTNMPEVEMPEHINPLTACDVKAGGDGPHNNSVIQIEITVTTDNDPSSEVEGEEEEGDNEET